MTYLLVYREAKINVEIGDIRCCERESYAENQLVGMDMNGTNQRKRGSTHHLPRITVGGILRSRILQLPILSTNVCHLSFLKIKEFEKSVIKFSCSQFASKGQAECKTIRR